MYSKYTSTVYDFDFAEIFTCAKTPRCHWHRRVKLHRIIDTAESSSLPVGVIGIAKSSSAVSLTPRSQNNVFTLKKSFLLQLKEGVLTTFFMFKISFLHQTNVDIVFYMIQTHLDPRFMTNILVVSMFWQYFMVILKFLKNQSCFLPWHPVALKRIGKKIYIWRTLLY